MAKRLLSKLRKKITDAQAKRDRFEIDAVEQVMKALKLNGKRHRPPKRPARGPGRAPSSR